MLYKDPHDAKKHRREITLKLHESLLGNEPLKHKIRTHAVYAKIKAKSNAIGLMTVIGMICMSTMESKNYCYMEIATAERRLNNHRQLNGVSATDYSKEFIVLFAKIAEIHRSDFV